MSDIETLLKRRHSLKLQRILSRKREELLSYTQKRLLNVPVRLVMDRDFLKLSPEDTIDSLIHGFSGEETAGVIVDEEDKLLGILTMKDLLRFFIPPTKYPIVGLDLLKSSRLTKRCKVKDFMVKNPITINVNDNLGQAIRVIVETGKHHLPVIDKERKVRGLLEVKDIIRFIRLTW